MQGEADELKPRLSIDQFRRSRSDGGVPYEYWCSGEPGSRELSSLGNASGARLDGEAAAAGQTEADAHSNQQGTMPLGHAEAVPPARAPGATAHVALAGGELGTGDRVVPGQELENAFQRLFTELALDPPGQSAPADAAGARNDLPTDDDNITVGAAEGQLSAGSACVFCGAKGGGQETAPQPSAAGALARVTDL